ncbi:MAG: hypothetical protein IPK07_31245 [Deltaproteobacteria bacterium]|nr:hypothetical protein [Deltaproteobacteria bacterium]
MPSHRCLSLVAGSLLLLGACGIDNQNQDGTTATAPDISGIFEGAFVSASDSRTHAITSLAVIRINANNYRLDFDVAPNDVNGVYDPEGYFLDTLLNTDPLESKVDDSGAMYVSARGGDLILNAVARKNGSFIEGDWLQVSPIEEHGLWSATRVASSP